MRHFLFIFIIFQPILSFAQGWIGNSNNLYSVNAAQALAPLNIGIGTKLPTAQLHTTGKVRFQGLTTNNALTKVLVSDSAGNLSLKDMSVLTSGNAWQLTGNAGVTTSIFLGTTDNAALRFRTYNTERMVITPQGLVGIGTNNPSVRLHLVTGNAGSMGKPYETMAIERNGDQKFGVYTTVSSFNMGGSALVLGYSNLQKSNGTFPGYEIQHGRFANSNNFFLRFNALERNASGAVLASSYEQVLILDDSGRVGVNLNNNGAPIRPTANLHSYGTVRFENLPLSNITTYLVIDDNGNIYRKANPTVTNAAAAEVSVAEYEDMKKKVDYLTTELNNLKKSLGIKGNLLGKDVPILYQNNPNPFNTQTSLEYYLPNTIKEAYCIIYDLQGKQLKKYVLLERNIKGKIQVSAYELKSGMYIYSLIGDRQEIDSKKMVILD
jgi:hypothetical protein